MTPETVDLNCDMGESFGMYNLGLDDQVIKYVTSANIACGFHAGDPLVMNRTVQLAANHNVAVGAHPGFPDLEGFGRRNMDCSPNEIRAYVTYQVGALMAFCAKHGVRLQHVKPHGCLYNMAAVDNNIARAIAEAVAGVDANIILVALAGKSAEAMSTIGREVGIRVAFEAFADRAYTPDGELVSRRLPGAVIKDPVHAAEQALRIVKEGRVIAIDSSFLHVEAQTLCIHGDTPGASDLLRSVRERLINEGIALQPLQMFC
ncbi:MAG: LamB/YcsF family protein [Desulfomonilaceae bacterium]